MTTREIAIVIGHSHGSQGAANAATGITEWQFNTGLAKRIAEEFCQRPGFIPMTIHRSTYEGLPKTINMASCDIAISLHANGAVGRATGSEVLYFPTSKSGKYLAALIQRQVVRCLGLRNRGIEGRERGTRGGWVLEQTKMPMVIVEPFFISNDADLARATERKQDLAKAIVQGITEYFNA